MFDVKCKRYKCVFNKNCNCTADKLNIKADTECLTYKPSNEAEVGEIEKVDQPAIRKNINVDCKAKCLFNKEYKCIANGITVQTCKNISNPNCCTFTKK